MRTPTSRRRLMAGVVGLLGAAICTPLIAAATPAGCTARPASAAASADLLRLSLLDVRPLGLTGEAPVSDLKIGPARSGLTTSGALHSAAAAQHLDGRAAGDVTAVYQQAPPANIDPLVRTAAQRNLGLLSVGAADLRAHASWRPEYACASSTGEVSQSSATLPHASILPGRNGTALLRLPSRAASETATRLSTHDGVAATATTGLTELALFAGTPDRIRVRVSKPPALSAGSVGGVRYTAPVLELTLPNGTTRRLDAAGERFEVAIPPNGGPSAVAAAYAHSEGMPLLASDPLGDLLTGSLPLLANLPLLSTPESTGTGLSKDQLAVLAVSIGYVRTEGARASVSAIRVELKVHTPAAHKSVTVLDVALGVLNCVATGGSGGTVPAPTGYPSTTTPSHSYPSTTPAATPTPTRPGHPGRLPTTGTGLALVICGGILAVAAGRLLMLVARRRA